MSDLNDFAHFFETVFSPDSNIWITDDVTKECLSCSVEQVLDWYKKKSPTGVYMAINSAMAPNLPRKKNNVLSKRSFLIEFDEMPLVKQGAYMRQLGLPWTSCTYSGGKSLHYLIVLEDTLDDKTYSEIFAKIIAQTEYLDLEGKVRYHVDPANKDVCRYSRLPSAFRGDKEQSLKKIKLRVPNTELLQWLADPARVKKWKESHIYKTIKKKEEVVKDGPTDRTPFIEALRWYMDYHIGINYNGDSFIQCPVCADNGGDKAGDNLHVTGANMLTHCFAHPDEHNPLLFKEIMKLKQEVVEQNTVVDFMENSND